MMHVWRGGMFLCAVSYRRYLEIIKINCVVHMVAHACVLFIGGFQCKLPMPV